MRATAKAVESLIKISGELDFKTSQALSADISSWPNSGEINVDLAEVGHCNSAALALLLEWMKIAQQKDRQIKYHNTPEQLLIIARAYGIEQQLPLI